jgi:3-oxoadipate enol-lactonase
MTLATTARTIAGMQHVRGTNLGITDTGSGFPFLWGHGFSADRRTDERSPMLSWRRLARRYRVVRWDARGHGDSDGTTEPDSYRWDNLGRDLVALADALGFERYAAGGVSMGAATALHAAHLAGGRIDALVLVLAPTAYETRAAQAGKYAAGADLVERRGIAAYEDRVNAEPVPEILKDFAGTYTFAPAVSEPLFPSVLRGAAASDLPPPEVVRTITVPTLLLAWESDRGHPVSTSQRLAELLPDAQLHVARELRDVAGWTGLVETFLEPFSDPKRR